MDKDVRIRELEAEVAELKRLLAEALGEIARLKKTSTSVFLLLRLRRSPVQALSEVFGLQLIVSAGARLGS